MLDTVKINHVQHISFTQSRLTDAVSVILSELLSYEHPSNLRGFFVFGKRCGRVIAVLVFIRSMLCCFCIGVRRFCVHFYILYRFCFCARRGAKFFRPATGFYAPIRVRREAGNVRAEECAALMVLKERRMVSGQDKRSGKGSK